MAHFAEVNDNNLVIRVLVVPDEQEHRGQEYLANDLGLGGRWIQCSYNHKIRKRFPSPDYSYDPTADVFIAPRKFESWYLDENFEWQPPIPYPTDGEDYFWDETSRSWKTFDEMAKMDVWNFNKYK